MSAFTDTVFIFKETFTSNEECGSTADSQRDIYTHQRVTKQFVSNCFGFPMKIATMFILYTLDIQYIYFLHQEIIPLCCDACIEIPFEPFPSFM